MKALTIRQPYSHLIAIGEKRVENRTWYAPQELWGQWIAIHAGKSRDLLTAGDWERHPDMPFGAIEALALLETCLSYREIEYGKKLITYLRWVKRHEHTAGPVCWVFSQIVRLDHPIPCKGAQRLWTVPNAVIRRIEVCRKGRVYGTPTE